MSIVRLSESRWIDTKSLTRYEREVTTGLLDEATVLRLVCRPLDGPRIVLQDGEASALVEVLEAAQFHPFQGLQFPVAISGGMPSDVPEGPTLAEVAEDLFRVVSDQVAQRKAEASMNLFQRMNRFVFGGGR